MVEPHSLAAHLDDFLTDLANVGCAHIRRAYRSDLIAFAAGHGEESGELSAAPVRVYLAEIARLSPVSRKRDTSPMPHPRPPARRPAPDQ